MPVYISRVSGGTVHCLDREGKVRKMVVDVTECQFKLSLHKKEFERVIRIIKQSRLSGHAIIAYLQKKGFPQVALHFVSDEQTRFNLAVECGNVDIALQAAQALDSKENWHRLGAEALKHGNHQVVEMAYQRTKDMEKLSFLYLMTGNIDKLKKMLKIAEMRSDVMGRFHNALYLGDVPERVKLLVEAGHIPLAYITALTYGLTEQAEALSQQLTAAGLPLPEPLSPAPKMLYPALPISRDSNWPLLTVSKGTFERTLAGGGGGGATADSGLGDAGLDLDDMDGGGGWGDDDLDLDGTGGGGGGGGGDPLGDDADPLGGEGADGDGWGTEELDLGDLPGGSERASMGGGYYVAPNVGMPLTTRWSRESRLAADHAAAGSFESAMQLLQRQFGLARLEPLRGAFLALAASSQSVLAPAPSLPSLQAPLTRPGGWPCVCISLGSLVEKLKAAYGLVTGGKFAEALDAFKSIMGSIALALALSRQQVAELKELLGICREYITGLRLELLRRTLGADEKARRPPVPRPSHTLTPPPPAPPLPAPAPPAPPRSSRRAGARVRARRLLHALQPAAGPHDPRAPLGDEHLVEGQAQALRRRLCAPAPRAQPEARIRADGAQGDPGLRVGFDR